MTTNRINEHISSDRIRQFATASSILDIAELTHLYCCDECTIEWIQVKHQLLERVRNLLVADISQHLKAA